MAVLVSAGSGTSMYVVVALLSTAVSVRGAPTSLLLFC
jgi:hypothetical protein